MLIQADPGTETLSSVWVDNRVADLIFAYNDHLDARTTEEELTNDKMVDLALLYSRKRPPASRDTVTTPPVKRRSDLTLLLRKLRVCMY
jgi:hypothetical protein